MPALNLRVNPTLNSPKLIFSLISPDNFNCIIDFKNNFNLKIDKKCSQDVVLTVRFIILQFYI